MDNRRVTTSHEQTLPPHRCGVLRLAPAIRGGSPHCRRRERNIEPQERRSIRDHALPCHPQAKPVHIAFGCAYRRPRIGPLGDRTVASRRTPALPPRPAPAAPRQTRPAGSRPITREGSPLGVETDRGPPALRVLLRLAHDSGQVGIEDFDAEARRSACRAIPEFRRSGDRDAVGELFCGHP